MDIQRKIVFMVLITLTLGQAKEDLDIMKEMMVEMKIEIEIEMNERISVTEVKLAKTEAELAATKDELAVTKDDLADTKKALTKAVSDQAENHAITKDDLDITKDNLAITREDLDITKEALMFKTDELEREVAILKAPPYIHSCGSHYDGLSASSGTIPYTSLLYSSTNTEGGGLDISTGVFTAPHGGSYTVSWDTQARLNRWEAVSIYLQKNGVTIEESLHNSYYGDNIDDHMNEQGGRTLVLHLDLGDTLQLYRDKLSHPGDIAKTTFCVSLTTFDIV